MTENKISVEEYCSYYRIDSDFIQQLHQSGLLEIEDENQITVIAFEQLPALERYIHLHYDLDINLAGIEAIQHLLNRLREMHQHIATLQNRLVTFH